MSWTNHLFSEMTKWIKTIIIIGVRETLIHTECSLPMVPNSRAKFELKIRLLFFQIILHSVSG